MIQTKISNRAEATRYLRLVSHHASSGFLAGNGNHRIVFKPALAILAVVFLAASIARAQDAWFLQSSGEILRSIHFIEDNTGWTVGGGGVILKTTDGGAKWSAQTSGTVQTLWSVHFTDANTGWAVGGGGAIVKTTDGGAKWSAQTSGMAQILWSVHFTDANTGWAVGEGGAILKTTDGGATWDAQTSGTAQTLWSVHITDANTGWAVGDYGAILKTTDGGAKWSAQTSGTTQTLWSVHFTDANTGWAVGGGGAIVKTTDGGVNWFAQNSGTMEFLRSIHFTDADTGWAVGTGGAIVKTTDGGDIWSAQSSGTTQTLYSVQFTDANTGWVVGGDGAMLKYEGTPHPSPPTLVAPFENSSDVALTPVLKWNTSATATDYRVQVAADESFKELFLDKSEVSDTSLRVLPALSRNSRYYWRVNAANTGGASDWSEVRSFTTSPPVSLIPRKFSLERFGQGQGEIRFALPQRTHVRAQLFEIQGKTAAVVLDEVREAGVYRLAIPRVGKGAYILDFQAGEFRRKEKVRW